MGATQRADRTRQRRRKRRRGGGRCTCAISRWRRRAPRRARGLGSSPDRSRVKHLLVTNDFPPKQGGIQSYLWELWRRLPSDEVTVLTTAHEGAAAWDAQQPFRVVRARA